MYHESEQEKKVGEKMKKIMHVRSLVKTMVASYPDYQIRAWCKASQPELAGDISMDWIKHKETLALPDQELVLELWKETLQMATNEVSVLVKNYGK
jgi:hypothetical protein